MSVDSISQSTTVKPDLQYPVTQVKESETSLATHYDSVVATSTPGNDTNEIIEKFIFK